MAWTIAFKAELIPYIEMVCEQYSIAPELVEAMIETESSWNPDAENGTCKGLMQISEIWHEDRMKRLGVMDIFDPQENILVGVDYLSELFQRYEDTGIVLDIYNGNSNAWAYYEAGETSYYTNKITTLAESLEKEKEEREMLNREQLLKTIDWETKHHNSFKGNTDVTISLHNTDLSKGTKGLNFTFRNGVYELFAPKTKCFKFGVYKNRMILLEADEYAGARLSNSKNNMRQDIMYARFASNNVGQRYSTWVGDYDLKYDSLYEYYYIEKKEDEE